MAKHAQTKKSLLCCSSLGQLGQWNNASVCCPFIAIVKGKKEKEGEETKISFSWWNVRNLSVAETTAILIVYEFTNYSASQHNGFSIIFNDDIAVMPVKDYK